MTDRKKPHPRKIQPIKKLPHMSPNSLQESKAPKKRDKKNPLNLCKNPKAPKQVQPKSLRAPFMQKLFKPVQLQCDPSQDSITYTESPESELSNKKNLTHLSKSGQHGKQIKKHKMTNFRAKTQPTHCYLPILL